MTPHITSVSCVDPCGKAIAVVGTYAGKIEAEEEDALTRPTPTTGKAALVVGSYAAKIVRLNNKEGVRPALPTAAFKKTAPGGRRGNRELACLSSRPTVAFELLG